MDVLERVLRLVGPVPASDILLAGLFIPVDVLSSPETPDLSTELTESRGLWDGVVVAVVGGRLTLVDAATGRAAGLFKVLPVDRAVVEAVGFVAAEGAFAGVGFVVMPGALFGGTLDFVAVF